MSEAVDPNMIPLPHPTALSKPHWDGCREGKLLVQQCQDCEGYTFIPQVRCSHCQSDKLVWVQSTGRGIVYSYSIVHRAPRPEFDAPYVVIIVAMEEGWHMLSNLRGCAPDAVSVDMPVKVQFTEMTSDITLPCFVRVDAE